MKEFKPKGACWTCGGQLVPSPDPAWGNSICVHDQEPWHHMIKKKQADLVHVDDLALSARIALAKRDIELLEQVVSDDAIECLVLESKRTRLSELEAQARGIQLQKTLLEAEIQMLRRFTKKPEPGNSLVRIGSFTGNKSPEA
jgi:hypothetical protein